MLGILASKFEYKPISFTTLQATQFIKKNTERKIYQNIIISSTRIDTLINMQCIIPYLKVRGGIFILQIEYPPNGTKMIWSVTNTQYQQGFSFIEAWVLTGRPTNQKFSLPKNSNVPYLSSHTPKSQCNPIFIFKTFSLSLGSTILYFSNMSFPSLHT